MKRFTLLAALTGILMLSLLTIGCGVEQQSELYKMEGVVVSVDYIAEGSSFNAPDIKNTVVEFEDGRVKSFNGISNEVFQKGKWNVITYNKRNRIISITTNSETEAPQ